MDALAGLGEIRFDFFTDEEVIQVGILVQQVERAVDRIVIGERDERHSALFGDSIDVFRRVVAVPGIRSAKVLEDGKTRVAVQIGSLDTGIRQHARLLTRGMIVQSNTHFLQFACP